MKLVIDTSVVGLAQLFETARTGIYRVISSLSQELLGRRELHLQYSSFSSIQVNQLTDSFYRARGFGEKSFPRNGIEKILIKLAGSNFEKGKDQIFLKVLSRLYRMSHTYRVEKESDIFHSMYSALPEFHSAGRPIRMMTIYDIIPLIHPEYFAEGFVEEFRPIVESFAPERDYLFTISECSKKDICSYFNMDPERIFVTPLAASQDLYSPVKDDKVINEAKKRYNIPDEPYFLTLATVEKRKNLQTSIQCFREILNEPGCENINFVLVGTRGWKVQDVVDMIDRDPILSKKVIFTGFVPDKFLSAIYSGAVGFLYPSLYEGFGLPPLEAMQCGVPVITSNTSSLPEVMGDAGVLVDPNDIDQISQAMINLVNDDDLREVCIRKGLKQAQKFSWKNCADKTIAGYRKAWDCR